jgi:energy-coupling factor transport system ATP-binding protein
MAGKRPMVDIKNLSFRYKGAERNALSGINLEIPEGDFLGIIGSSGAGKSTLVCAINGVAPHHFPGDFYGQVLVNGLDTLEAGAETLARQAGSVFQDIDGQMVASVVEDEILFGLENFAVPHEEIEGRIAEALAAAGIADLRQREISSLSGGQKQKVVIAAITALKPRIIILDEPTGELDPYSSRKIFEYLKELNESSGITIIVVEQKNAPLRIRETPGGDGQGRPHPGGEGQGGAPASRYSGRSGGQCPEGNHPGKGPRGEGALPGAAAPGSLPGGTYDERGSVPGPRGNPCCALRT